MKKTGIIISILAIIICLIATILNFISGNIIMGFFTTILVGVNIATLKTYF